MTLLDLLAGGTRDLLGAVMPEAAATLWVPLLVVVLWLGGVLFVKHVVAALGRVGRMVLTGAAVGVGALLLLPEFAFATAYRRAAQRPPAFVYGFGDIVAAGAGTIGKHAGATVEAPRRPNGAAAPLHRAVAGRRLDVAVERCCLRGRRIGGRCVCAAGLGMVVGGHGNLNGAAGRPGPCRSQPQIASRRR